jgi:hypothetical protein
MYFIPRSHDINIKRQFAGQTLILLGVTGIFAYILLSTLASPLWMV